MDRIPNTNSTIRIPNHSVQLYSKASAMKNSTIPPVSYSSSDDDEDDFFDAQDDVASKSGSEIVHVQAPSPDLVSPLTPSDIDWDSLYANDDGKEEDVDMQSHGSVITHLLSQVRIGEDGH